MIRAKHYLEWASVEHDNQNSCFLLGWALMDLREEQYEGVDINGHCVIPKALYWWRKAAARPDAIAEEIEACKWLEGVVMKYCHNCDKKEDDFAEKLKACGLCKAAYYCGKECQTNHWKAGHKVDCIKRNYPPKRVGSA